jgi:hypothetical protein
MAAAGVARDHIAKVLNHVEGGARATRVYDRHSYDEEKRMALETWDRVLTGILEPMRYGIYFLILVEVLYLDSSAHIIRTPLPTG